MASVMHAGMHSSGRILTVTTNWHDYRQVHIPTVKITSQRRVRGTDDQETVTEDRSRGFGFVQFLCPRDAARVVKVRDCFEAVCE